MVNYLIAGALILTPVASQVPSPTKAPNVAQNEAESLVEGTEKKSPPTPEDYWVPLDNWLKKQGSPLSGKDFYEIGQQYKIDPDFLIAVTKAETNLGKVQQRGSACNVGSVGSYDSTNTTHSCGSHRHGIEMIAQTVNNGYLGGYVRVSQLSRFGNPHGKVYASSPINWHRNVVNTMNALKGKNETDYGFRLTDS